jgi:hypothetical protein
LNQQRAFCVGCATKKCAHFPTPAAQSALENALKFMQTQSSDDSGRDLFANQQTRNNFCCLVFLTSYKIDKDFQQQQRAAKAAAAPQRRGIWRFLHTFQPHIPKAYEYIYILGIHTYSRIHTNVCVHMWDQHSCSLFVYLAVIASL